MGGCLRDHHPGKSRDTSTASTASFARVAVIENARRKTFSNLTSRLSQISRSWDFVTPYLTNLNSVNDYFIVTYPSRNIYITPPPFKKKIVLQDHFGFSYSLIKNLPNVFLSIE